MPYRSTQKLCSERRWYGVPFRRHHRRPAVLPQDRCVYCGSVSDLTLDHYIPRSRGGGRGNNLVTACQACNGAKGNRLPLEFIYDRPAAD